MRVSRMSKHRLQNGTRHAINDLLKNIVGRQITINPLDQIALRVEIEQRGGLPVKDTQPIMNRLGVVVRSFLDLCSLEQSINQARLVNRQIQHHRDPIVLTGEMFTEDLRLQQGAWKTIEHATRIATTASKKLLHDPHNKKIGR